jgi:DNA-binding MarR family transcriptional regulator
VFLALHGPSTLTQGGYRRQLATASVTALIDRLEHLGLVARRRHRSDRRKVVVDLSETGQNAAELVHCQLGAALGDAASLWSRNRVPQLPPTRENRAVHLSDTTRRAPTLHLGRGHHPVVITEVTSPPSGLD